MSRPRKRRRRPAGRDTAGVGVSLKVAYFFLPLETPLSIPDKSIFRGQERPPPESGFEQRYLGVDWDDYEGLFGCRISCRFHHLVGSEIDAFQYAALEAVRVAFPSTQFGDDSSGPVSQPVTVTVAEVAVALDGDSDSDLSNALDEAVALVADLQRAYSAVARQPMPITTRSRLPLLVPYAIRTVTHGENEPRWPAADDIDVMFPREPAVHRLLPPPSAEQPARFSGKELVGARAPVLDGPFRHVHESWRNANVALGQGDYAVAAILMGVTCEQSIRALLLCLLWEDELDPPKAFRVLYERNGNTRNANTLLAAIIDRLSISRETDLAAQEMAVGVLDLRNRVLHRAHQPTRDEVQEASDHCTRFAEWTRFAVLSRLDRYAVTAAMTVSKPDIDEEAASRLDKALTSGLWPTRPNDNVRHYQIEIDRHQPGNEAKRLGKADRMPSGDWAMMSLAYPNGEVRWVGVEERNWLAFLARPPRDLPARARKHLRESIEQAQVENAEHGDKPIVVYRWNDLQPLPQSATPLLHSWFDLGPLLRAERYARCPTPFISAD